MLVFFRFTVLNYLQNNRNNRFNNLIQPRFIIFFLSAVFCSHTLSASDNANPQDLHLWQKHRSSGYFTQGLVYANGVLYESSGLYGKSLILARNLQSNQITLQRNLPANLFAEGLAFHNGSLYLLSWKAGKALKLNPKDLSPITEFNFKGEGWGLTSDGNNLIMSNGSAKLFFRNPNTFAIEKEILVHLDGKPLAQLNELEWITGFIWANIWQTDDIAVIDPKTGQVVNLFDYAYLRANLAIYRHIGVLNGIAWHADSKCLILTGKYWPVFFALNIAGTQGCTATPFAP